jgi:uncharacterized protein YcnI
MKRLLFAAACAAPLAQAHVALDQASAPAGAHQKLTFKVGHGCAGSATTGITVLLPDGVASAKPMPKPGWTLSAAEGKPDAPVKGRSGAAPVREISWRGGPLPDAYYDEFNMQVKLPETPGKYYFKVTQTCEQGRMEWHEIPGVAGVSLKAPAPVLQVLPPAAHMHQH